MAAGRRTSLASLAGQKVEDVPGQSDLLLLTLPLDRLVPTRFNPRRNFGSEADLREFGLRLEKRQLQPAVAVSRSAYLKLWPEEASHVSSASYVIANGERRYRGSLAANLTTLDVVHNEDVAKSRADFLDAVLSENNDREDLDPIERAIGIETMVQELGGADKVARYYEKTNGWVSQQRKLLRLTEPLQELVSCGEIPIRVARDIAGLPAAEQAAAWLSEQQRRQAAQAAPRAARGRKAARQEGGSRFTPVNRPKPPAKPEERGTAAGSVPSQMATPPSVPREDHRTEQPEQAASPAAAPALVITSESPEDVADALMGHLPTSVLTAVAELLMERLSSGQGARSA